MFFSGLNSTFYPSLVIPWPQTLHVPSSCPVLALFLAHYLLLPPWLLACDLVFAVIVLPSVNFSQRSSSSQDVTWQRAGQRFFCLISHTHTNGGFVYRYAMSVDMHYGAWLCLTLQSSVITPFLRAHKIPLNLAKTSISIQDVDVKSHLTKYVVFFFTIFQDSFVKYEKTWHKCLQGEGWLLVIRIIIMHDIYRPL